MTRRSLGVAVVGCGWMGHVHARAFSRVLQHYPNLTLAPELALVADPEPDRLSDAIQRVLEIEPDVRPNPTSRSCPSRRLLRHAHPTAAMPRW